MQDLGTRFHMMMRCLLFTFLLTFFCTGSLLRSQDIVQPGTNESSILNFDTAFIARTYFSVKYLNTSINNRRLPRLNYHPNSKLAFGLGGSYGWLTLNLSANLGFLQSKDNPRGKSKTYDLQGHFYGPKSVVDFFASFYDGQYLAPKGRGIHDDSYYVRPDVESWQLGFAGYYALNWRNFSYRSSFLQTAWQQKSAGSFLLGFELRHGQIKADSALVPAIYALSGIPYDINRYRYFNLGPGIGYAYTLVMAGHWFATGAATVNVAANWVRETAAAAFRERTFSVRPNTSYKLALGYNVRKFSVSATWAQNNIYNKGVLGNYDVSAGNLRLHFVYRFIGGKKFREFFDFLQKP